MEGLLPGTEFAKLVGRKLGDDYYTLLDIGCGGGIDRAWRCFGARLRSLGFDPNIAEVERLNAAEINPSVQFIAGFVGLPDDHPIAKAAAGHGFWGRNPWNRFSVHRTIQITQQLTDRLSDVEKVAVNAWNQTKLVEGPTIYLPSFLAERGFTDIDFIKIDVDGPDYLILKSLEDSLATTGVLGVGIEVNFFGSADPLDHTFHNVDRFMRQQGFDLFGLTTRPYSVQALPAPYQSTVPTQSISGRPFQGDALYMRDLASPEFTDLAGKMSGAKLAKLAAIYSLTGLPDCAAEVLITFRDRLAPILDINAALDLLVGQTGLGRRENLSYCDYMRLFEQNDKIFYPSRSEEIVHRIQKAKTYYPGLTQEVFRRIKEALRRRF